MMKLVLGGLLATICTAAVACGPVDHEPTGPAQADLGTSARATSWPCPSCAKPGVDYEEGNPTCILEVKDGTSSDTIEVEVITP